MSDRFESLESGEVVSIQHETQVLSGHRTFRSGELNDAIKGLVEKAIPGWSEEKNDWFTDRGIDCEALRFGSKGWQKGRIRLSLEFCPDEPDQSALSDSSSSSNPTTKGDLNISAAGSPSTHANPVKMSVAQQDEVLSLSQDTPPVVTTGTASTNNQPTSSIKTVVAPPQDKVLSLSQDNLPVAATDTTSTQPQRTDLVSPNVAIPVAGIAASVVVATVANMSNPAKTSSAPVAPVSTSPAIPHFDDAVLEEHHDVDSISPNSGGLDELAFVFDESDNDRGRMIPNGMMEIDLADGLDFSEHDLLSFEANGMTDAEGFGSFQDIGKPENSGALIDEVWNEMNQGSWPKVN
jgi:KGK domain